MHARIVNAKDSVENSEAVKAVKLTVEVKRQYRFVILDPP
jgi:hypothetical protein